MELIDMDFIDLMRRKQKIRFAELAAKMNMTPTELSEIICEPASPITFKQAYELAYLLECSPCQLFVDPERVYCTPKDKK